MMLQPRPYEPVPLKSWSYTMTPEDFADGCYMTVSYDETGCKVFGSGKNALGFDVSTQLFVPLCKGCDSPLDKSCCHDCQLVFIEVEDD